MNAQLHISWFDAAASGDVPRLAGLLRLRNALDINTQLSASGKTALYQACDWNRPAAIKFLLEKGADPRIAARDGSTALDRCVAHEFAECTELIRAALASEPPPEATGSEPPPVVTQASEPAPVTKQATDPALAAARKQAMDDDLERLRMERDEGRITAAMYEEERKSALTAYEAAEAAATDVVIEMESLSSGGVFRRAESDGAVISAHSTGGDFVPEIVPVRRFVTDPAGEANKKPPPRIKVVSTRLLRRGLSGLSAGLSLHRAYARLSMHRPCFPGLSALSPLTSAQA